MFSDDADCHSEVLGPASWVAVEEGAALGWTVAGFAVCDSVVRCA